LFHALTSVATIPRSHLIGHGATARPQQNFKGCYSDGHNMEPGGLVQPLGLEVQQHTCL